MLTSIFIVIAAAVMAGLLKKVFGEGKWDILFFYFQVLSTLFLVDSMLNSGKSIQIFWAGSLLAWSLVYLVYRQVRERGSGSRSSLPHNQGGQVRGNR